MKPVICALVITALFGAKTAIAGTTNYDMSSILFDAHPFASTAPLIPVVAGPATVRQAHGRRPVAPPVRQIAPLRQRPPVSVRQTIRPAAVPVQTTKAPMGYPAQVAAMPKSEESGGFQGISEIRLGVLAHDMGPFSSNEEGGVNGNFELLFHSPDFLDIIWAPRPHVGMSINGQGDTSQVYAGLSWEWSFWRHWFAGFSLGGSIHDGKLSTDRSGRKELGCRILFRESVEIGYRFGGKHSISGFLDHISNANICDKNEGLETSGIRYGYKF